MSDTEILCKCTDCYAPDCDGAGVIGYAAVRWAVMRRAVAQGRARDGLDIVADQIGGPSCARELAGLPETR